MAIVGQLGDRAGHTSATTGAGTITLGLALGAVAPNLCGFQSFSAAGITDQMTVSYLILDSNGAWEVGRGTYTASGTTLTRGATFSSNSNAAISLSGNEQVFISLLQEDAIAVNQMIWTGGRLTPVTATPVLTSNQTAKGTIFYTPHIHNLISIYDGFVFQTYTFTEQSVVLDSSNFLSGHVYDLFMFINAGVPTLGYGPAWTNTTTRSAAISRQNGVWTNTLSITLRTAVGTTFSVNSNKATYVGTAYATANGQTGMAFTASAAGGGGNVLGLFSAYNQVQVNAYSQDSNSSWNNSSATWVHADANANNAISYVDGLGVCAVSGTYSVAAGYDTGTGVTTVAEIGAMLNWASGAPTFTAFNEVTAQSASFFTVLQLAAQFNFLPTLGYNTVSALESADSGSVVFFEGNGSQQLMISLWM